MAGEDFCRLQCEMLFQRGAGGGEHRVKHPAHGEHRGSRVDPRIPDGDLAHLAAGGCGALHHHHLGPGGSQFHRRHQAGNSRPHHHDLARSHPLLCSAVRFLVDVTVKIT